MNQRNLIGVDLAKSIFQVCILNKKNQVKANKAIKRNDFARFLAKQPKSVIAFETCSGSHYWGWQAEKYGHEVLLIPAKAVTAFRLGHKTDANDALAVTEAAQRPELKLAPLKSIEQLEIQAIQRARKHLVDERTALSNLIRSQFFEFGLVIPKGFCSLKSKTACFLEDAENILPSQVRASIHRLIRRFNSLQEDIKFFDKQVNDLIKQNEPCQRLMSLEGIGAMGASQLYAFLGSGQAFKNGREAAACIGLTPKQFSSGGKTNLIGIGRRAVNSQLRTTIIQGAVSVVYKLKVPKTKKEAWLLKLIERSGCRKAAVALANKNVRTAWAMLRNNTVYQAA